MYSVGEVLLHLLNTISSIWLTSIAFTQKTPTAEALSVLLQFDHLSSSSDDITLQLMEKREKTYRKRVCKFCYRVSLRASSQLKGIWWKVDAKAGAGSAARSRVLARLATLAWGDVTRDDLQRLFSAQHSVAMLEQCCNHSKQCYNNAVMLCFVKNRRCKSSRVASPLNRRACLQDSTGLYFVVQLKRLFHSICYSKEWTGTQWRNHIGHRLLLPRPYSPRDLLALTKEILEKDKITLASC